MKVPFEVSEKKYRFITDGSYLTTVAADITNLAQAKAARALTGHDGSRTPAQIMLDTVTGCIGEAIAYEVLNNRFDVVGLSQPDYAIYQRSAFKQSRDMQVNGKGLEVKSVSKVFKDRLNNFPVPKHNSQNSERWYSLSDDTYVLCIYVQSGAFWDEANQVLVIEPEITGYFYILNKGLMDAHLSPPKYESSSLMCVYEHNIPMMFGKRAHARVEIVSLD